MEENNEKVNVLGLSIFTGVCAGIAYICGAISERRKAMKVIDSADLLITLLKEKNRRLLIQLHSKED